MTEAMKQPRRGLVVKIAQRLMLAISMIVVMILGVPSIASAADECDPSQFQTENGFEITAYELCKNPSTNVEVAVPGAPVQFQAAGFAGNSQVEVYLHLVGCGDAPECSIFVGYGYTDENGVLIFDFALPAGLPEGAYEIVAEGLDAEGNPRTVTSQPITVTAELPIDGKLPYTGSKPLRLTAIGAGLFALGGVAIASTRRLKRATH